MLQCKPSDKITYAVVSRVGGDRGLTLFDRLLKDNGLVLAGQSLAMVGDGSDILCAAVATGHQSSLQQAIIKFGKYVNRYIWMCRMMVLACRTH